MWVVPAEVAAQAKPLAQSAWLYRIARAPQAARVEALLERADERAQAGAQAFPSGFRAVCERTRALQLPANNAGVDEGRRRALELLAHQALARKAQLDAALVELDRARRIDPKSPEVIETRVRVLALWEEPTSVDPCEVRYRAAEAVDALRELHALGPELRSSQSMAELGSWLSRQGSFAQAAAAYRQAISLAFDARERSTAYGRLAEATMLAGDAEGALTHYEHALAQAEPGRERTLLHFGLALARDRVGEHDAAVEQAVLALEGSERSLEVLAPDSVLFEPASERALYEALGHEALARILPEHRAESLQAAADRYTAFLTQPDAHPLYRNAAEADLRRVVAQLQALSSSTPPEN